MEAFQVQAILNKEFFLKLIEKDEDKTDIYHVFESWKRISSLEFQISDVKAPIKILSEVQALQLKVDVIRIDLSYSVMLRIFKNSDQ